MFCYVSLRQTEVDALIAHVEDKCWHDNPASKINSISEVDGKLTVKTTTEWLAMRIGKEIKKAHKGELVVKQSPEKNMVWVHWTSPS